MEETDLSQLSEEEITDMYSNIIESGEVLAKAKGCYCASPYYYNSSIHSCCKNEAVGHVCYPC